MLFAHISLFLAGLIGISLSVPLQAPAVILMRMAVILADSYFTLNELTSAGLNKLTNRVGTGFDGTASENTPIVHRWHPHFCLKTATPVDASRLNDVLDET